MKWKEPDTRTLINSLSMEVIKTTVEGPLILKPRVFKDDRGYFFESYNKEVFDSLVGKVNFVQDNESCSKKGVIRGLHFQKPPFAQAKLVRCVRGRVLDVALDIRKGSPTFGQHVSVELSEENKLEFFIPHGFAHGFAVLSEEAVFQYKCDNLYNPQSEGAVSILDESLGIDWKVCKISEAILSEKDKHNPMFKDLETPFYM